MGCFFSLALWAYRTSKKTLTQATPSSLVYGTGTMVLVEVGSRLVFTRNRFNPHGPIYDVKALEEIRHITESKWLSYQKQVRKAYTNRPWTLCVTDLVLKPVGYIQKRVSASKFAPKYEGPYFIREAYDSNFSLFLSLIHKIFAFCQCYVVEIVSSLEAWWKVWRKASTVSPKLISAIYVDSFEAYQVLRFCL